MLLATSSLFAQYPTTQLLLNDVPQSKYYNAGFFPEYSGHFGFPGLSNISGTASSSGFAMKDLFVDKNTLNLEGLVDGLETKNFINTGFGIEVLTFGFKVKKNYFSFNITPKVDVNFGYNKDLLGFIVNGNGDYVGKSISFDGTGFDISVYNEVGFGYTREVDEKLSIGGRLKLLTGGANVSGNFDGISLHTDKDDFTLTANSTFSINQYGAHLMGGEKGDSLKEAWGAPLVNPSNFGVGIDFGAAYKVSDKINVFASVVDLGYLSWKDYGETLYNDGASFSFGGLPLDELLNSDTTTTTTTTTTGGEEEESFFDGLSDSISDVFSLERERKSYTTSLKSKIFAGVNYKINKYFDADGVLHGRFFGSKFYPAVMLGVGANLGSWFRLKLSYAATNGSYDNLGAAAVFNLGAFQIYGAMDNLYGITQLDYAKNITGSFGINFVFRKDKDDEQKIDKRKKENKPLIKSEKPRVDAASEVELVTEVTPVKEEVSEVKSDVQPEATIITVKDSAVSNTDFIPTKRVEKSNSIVSSPLISDSSVVAPVLEAVEERIEAKDDSTSSSIVPASITSETAVEKKDSLTAPVSEIKDIPLENVVDSIKTSTLIKEL